MIVPILSTWKSFPNVNQHDRTLINKYQRCTRRRQVRGPKAASTRCADAAATFEAADARSCAKSDFLRRVPDGAGKSRPSFDESSAQAHGNGVVAVRRRERCPLRRLIGSGMSACTSIQDRRLFPCWAARHYSSAIPPRTLRECSRSGLVTRRYRDSRGASGVRLEVSSFEESTQ